MHQPPLIERYGDEVRVLWNGPKIGYEFRNWRENFGLQAELTVVSLAVENAGLFGPFEIHPMKPNEVKNLVSDLNEMHPTTKDWQDLSLLSCREAVRSIRKAPDPVILGCRPDPGPPRYLIPGFLFDDANTMLVAQGGSSKSYFAMLTAVCMASGEPLLLDKFRPVERCEVLYLDWEDAPDRQEHRFYCVCRGMGFETLPGGVHYWRCTRPLLEMHREIKRYIERKNIGLVIVDSIGGALGGELVKDEVAIRGMTACNDFSPAARLIVGHIAKAARGVKMQDRTAFGSGYFENNSRAVWQLKGKKIEGTSLTNVAFINTKDNYGAEPAFGGQWRFETNPVHAVYFTYLDPADVIADSDAENFSDLIMALMKEEDRELTTREISNLAGVTFKQATDAITKLKKSNQVIRLDDGGRGKTATWARNLQKN